MAVRHYTFSLTTAASALNIGDFDKHSAHPTTIIFNIDKGASGTVMIGGSTVSDTDYGIHLDADDQFVISSHYSGDGAGFYARAKTGTVALHCLVID